ncbi:hypothetical protein ASPZODRAFT_64269 [Penicilliopsis zonata CBS 506.65]|uniref:Glycoside hydrolase family 5 domain-containing protein n=1 Tax=Penicilliopsis zonata CBS 506.65 TaxID=1073090 RepID=A0A1L9SKL5_9EURO|nr:hypothetical protein ASPZODRAFT_64269 [Penicilliopsis zonata CBS 506.65]OJJ47643.1 hypothetical protein ASPZODRAFT_64269 [Penicilliopsis zonata CBS 506.65]
MAGRGPSRPTEQDIFRYRYQHGTNLGSIFVLERWLKGSMFIEGTQGSSELAAVKRSLQTVGLEETRARWEAHWLTALTEEDFSWLRDVAKCNSIRLPIGYFTLGPTFCTGTGFDGDPAKVYLHAWSAAKHLIENCYQHGIGVLIDLHALPGGANGDSHSGTDDGQAALWNNKKYRALARDCIAFVAQEVMFHAMAGVIGIQVCNEAKWDAPGMYEWYDEVLEVTSAVDPSLPIYISDGWNLSRAIDYAMARNKIPISIPRSPVVVDTHKYYTFSEAHRSMSPDALIAAVKSDLAQLNGRQGDVLKQKGAIAVYIGEYSCTLDTRTWDKVSPSERPRLTKSFGQEQSRVWTSKASGSAFWTLKMDWMDGGDWGFKEQVKQGAILPPPWLGLPLDRVIAIATDAEDKRSQLQEKAVSEHTGYWDRTSPGVQFEHHLYAHGWDIGFNDAMVFFCARLRGTVPPGQGDGGDKIGALDLWVRKRIIEANQQDGKCAWEWEHGLRRGVHDFYSIVGV